MPGIPAGVEVGRVTWLALSTRAGQDELRGLTGNVTLTLNTDRLRVGSVATLYVESSVFEVRNDGKLYNGDSSQCYVVGTDIVGIDGLQYRVDVELSDGKVRDPFYVEVPGGEVVDLTSVVPVDPADPVFRLSGPKGDDGTPGTPGAPGSNATVTAAAVAAVLPSRLSDVELRAALVPFWAPGETVAQGAVRMTALGVTITRNTAGTTGSTYDSTEAAKWTAVSSGGTVPDATNLAKGKVALLGDFGGTADQPRLRTQTRNERSGTPVLTKLDLTIGTLAAVGLATIYVPWLIRVPDAVFAAFPQYGRWRVYTSTDHDSGDGGVAIGVCMSDDIETAANWTWLRLSGSPVMFKDGTNRQTETPCVVWNPVTALFHMYYQIAVGTTQTTRVATSPNGVDNWTIVGDAITNLPTTVAGWNHTGYARIYYLDGIWAAWHLEGTGATSAYGWSFSKDGFTWITDRRRVGAAVHMTDGVLRLGISALLRFRGELWAVGTWSEYVSGANSSTTVPVWAAPISLAADLRQLTARPQRIATDGGCPTAFATHPDGRLFGATREGGATGSLKLAVLA